MAKAMPSPLTIRSARVPLDETIRQKCDSSERVE